MGLILKTVDEDGFDHEGIQIPKIGVIEAPSWDEDPSNGSYGIKGHLNGGYTKGTFIHSSKEKQWVVLQAEPSDTLMLNGFREDNLVKIKRGYVVFCGEEKEAQDYITNN